MESIHIKVGTELKNQLKEESQKKGISLNDYVRMILLERGK